MSVVHRRPSASLRQAITSASFRHLLEQIISNNGPGAPGASTPRLSFKAGARASIHVATRLGRHRTANAADVDDMRTWRARSSARWAADDLLENQLSVARHTEPRNLIVLRNRWGIRNSFLNITTSAGPRGCRGAGMPKLDRHRDRPRRRHHPVRLNFSASHSVIERRVVQPDT